MIPGKSDQGGHRVLIKSADDKSKRLALLEDLQKSPLLDRRQRDWLRDEQFRLKRGIAGERDAASSLCTDPHNAWRTASRINLSFGLPESALLS
jgi:hypothetical protein